MAPVNPGGRTGEAYGTERRTTEWSRPPEPWPAARGILVMSLYAATACEFDQAYALGRVQQSGSDHGFKIARETNDARNIVLDLTFLM